MDISEVPTGSKVLIKLRKGFRLVQGRDRYKSESRGRGVVSEITGTVLSNGSNTISVAFKCRKGSTSGTADILYRDIGHMWRWGGKTNADTVVKHRTPAEDRTITSTHDSWPYTAKQFPASEIFAEKITITWS